MRKHWNNFEFVKKKYTYTFYFKRQNCNLAMAYSKTRNESYSSIVFMLKSKFKKMGFKTYFVKYDYKNSKIIKILDQHKTSCYVIKKFYRNKRIKDNFLKILLFQTSGYAPCIFMG